MGERTIAVVVPTYNERENIKILVEKIFRLNIPQLHLVVIDDNSPDGTGAVTEGLRASHPITVKHRACKSGLGDAYREAFLEIDVLAGNPDIVIQMDADLSHDPNEIPRFLEEIKKYDVVLGSRYVSGGGIKNWNVIRRIISRLSNLYACIVLSLPFHDLTGGFKCWRKEVLQSINLQDTSSIGYNFQIETTFRAFRRGFRIAEIPITFTERTLGKSKFSLPIIFESFWRVLMLRYGTK